MSWIALVLLSVALILLASQAVILFWVLFSTKQRWYHYLSLVLAGVIAIWLSLNLVQMQAHIQDLWSLLVPRTPPDLTRSTFESIDQAFFLCISQVTVLLALAVVLFVLWHQAYPRLKRISDELNVADERRCRDQPGDPLPIQGAQTIW